MGQLFQICLGVIHRAWPVQFFFLAFFSIYILVVVWSSGWWTESSNIIVAIKCSRIKAMDEEILFSGDFSAQTKKEYKRERLAMHVRSAAVKGSPALRNSL